MNGAKRLVCFEPSPEFHLRLEDAPHPVPKAGEVVVRVRASSVNPIDCGRAAGYGRRLLALKGASRFPLVLGNDLAGHIEAVGPNVERWRVGDAVFGLTPTGPVGAHASHVVVSETLLRRQIDGVSAAEHAAFPYSFTTVWIALDAVGLLASATGANVLIHGAGGGLGRLATQMLSRRGARVTAVCSTRDVDACRTLGATTVCDRKKTSPRELPQDFDVALNFGAFVDEEMLIDRLRQGARGHASAVHSLLANFDSAGWIGGAWRSWRDFSRLRALAGRKGALYRWILFSPRTDALDALVALLEARALSLPVGIAAPASEAVTAFEHVARRRDGRAILLF
ncbi:MAG TPA: alcohol dehydrogenase catalytic domain-containing protein [Roseiarcus sp.]|nr:alcohol dehydrogenase catalytic domain-containing protein [Roseiarcus sp.]